MMRKAEGLLTVFVCQSFRSAAPHETHLALPHVKVFFAEVVKITQSRTFENLFAAQVTPDFHDFAAMSTE